MTLRAPEALAFRALVRSVAVHAERDVSPSDVIACLVAGHNPSDLAQCLLERLGGAVGSGQPGPPPGDD